MAQSGVRWAAAPWLLGLSRSVSPTVRCACLGLLQEPAVEFLASRGYAPEYGARPVKRALQRELQTLLAQVGPAD